MVAANRETRRGYEYDNVFYFNFVQHGKDVTSAQRLEVSLCGVGAVFRVYGMRGLWSNDLNEHQLSTQTPISQNTPSPIPPPSACFPLKACDWSERLLPAENLVY